MLFLGFAVINEVCTGHCSIKSCSLPAGMVGDRRKLDEEGGLGKAVLSLWV